MYRHSPMKYPSRVYAGPPIPIDFSGCGISPVVLFRYVHRLLESLLDLVALLTLAGRHRRPPLIVSPQILLEDLFPVSAR